MKLDKLERAGGWSERGVSDAIRARIIEAATHAGADDAGAAALVDTANHAVHLYHVAGQGTRAQERKDLARFTDAADALLGALLDMSEGTRGTLAAEALARSRPREYAAGAHIRRIAEDVLLLRNCAARATPKKQAGREPANNARLLVSVLAEAWQHATGKRPTHSRRTAFYAYARAVLESAGYVRREVAGTGSESVEALLRSALIPA